MSSHGWAAAIISLVGEELDKGRWVRLYAGDWERLQLMAEEDDRDVSYVIRRLVRDFLNERVDPRSS